SVSNSVKSILIFSLGPLTISSYRSGDERSNDSSRRCGIQELGTHHGRILEYRGHLLGLLEAGKKSEVLALESAGQTSAGARLEELDELLSVHVEELVEINSTVRELAESSLFLKLSKIRLVLAHV
ncbi:hypothetical protein PFISCL1PPCAC_16751, partial [Pristionchus fissidentatus]